MAWGKVKVEDKRKQFIEDCLAGRLSKTDLCHVYDISRPTGDKWLNRFLLEGDTGLNNRSRARKNQSQQTSVIMVKKILSLKMQYDKWGAKKIRSVLLRDEDPPLGMEVPSLTTVNKILLENGLVKTRKLRQRIPVRTEPLAHCINANDVWCGDFKGWFKTGDGKKCEPFTVTDGSTRFLLRCLDLNANDVNHVWAVLDHAFREYGLPLFFRSDNGPPFATCGAGRLSRLSINLIKAGIIPEWIDPGKPQQNGRHERMHQTLKNEVANPPELTLEEQKMKLNKFKDYYNFIRPHEALNQQTPGSIYQASPRMWYGKLTSPEYATDLKVKRVRDCGKMSWKCGDIYIGRVFINEPIGIEEIEDGIHAVYYGPIILGLINQKNEFQIIREQRNRTPYCKEAKKGID